MMMIDSCVGLAAKGAEKRPHEQGEMRTAGDYLRHEERMTGRTERQAP